jgi:hypothetical protein
MIDITKKYPVHGAIKWDGGWDDNTWGMDGSYADGDVDGSLSLISVKTWRAWDASRDMVPKRLMTRSKHALGGQCTDGITLVYPGSLQFIFDNFMWLHEDGTESPCGVEQ